MVNLEHLAIIKQGIAKWNLWQKKNWKIDAELESAYLAGMDLNGANFIRGNFRNAILTKANLKGSRLNKAMLENSNLSGANLENADLTDANLKNADLTGANLERANLSGAILRRANLSHSNLSWSNLRAADLEYSYHLSQDNVNKAYGNNKTKLPPGLNFPQHWKAINPEKRPNLFIFVLELRKNLFEIGAKTFAISLLFIICALLLVLGRIVGFDWVEQVVEFIKAYFTKGIG